MAMTYASRRKADDRHDAAPAKTTAPGPSLDALKGGAMPSQEQMGHRVDLPGAIREKMEASFGMDFSGVQLYESQAVEEAGAKAMAMGNKIGFAPGQLDLVSSGGQAVLGHELSHIAAQARGEVSGTGFLNDHALEARADREGAMAAAGESVYNGPVTPISTDSTALSAAGPMQAKDKKKSGLSDIDPSQVEHTSGKAAIYKMVSELPSEYIEAHPEILEGLAVETGQQANAALQTRQAQEGGWEGASTAAFRGAGGSTPQAIAFNALLGRKLQGKDNALTTGLTGENTEASADADHTLLNERMEQSGVMPYLELYGQTAFQGGAGGQFSPEQQSAMVMQNFMTRAVSGTLGNAGDMGKAGSIQKRYAVNKETGEAADTKRQSFMSRLAGKLRRG